MTVMGDFVSRDTNNSMDFMIHEPIRSGFLLKYCNEHFCSENMRFVVEVDRFRDLFHVDKACWSKKTWKQLDTENDIVSPELEDFNPEDDFLIPLREGRLFDEASWPSKRLPLSSVKAAMEHIWHEFLADNAPYWICIPRKILINTIKRMKLIIVYGRDCFGEAMLDPVKTIQKDIQPRFLASEDYRALRQLLSGLEPLPGAMSLKLPKPPHVIFNRYSQRELEAGQVAFTMEDLVADRLLFPEFLKYLELQVSSENLRCLRAIQVYVEARSSSDSRDFTLAQDYAWTIYKYFVAPGSAYGISLSHRKLKEVMRALAQPTLTTFDGVQRSAISALKVHFAAFKETKEYANLGKVVLANKDVAMLATVSSKEVPISNSAKVSPSLSAVFRNTCFPGI